jgi:drug/metabolite transporter (DMT)-like permease
MRALTKRQWVNLFLLGIVFYAFTQGTQFIGLYYLPAVTVSLMLNTTPLIVIAFGILFLGEYPSLIQWVGSVCFITGVYLYFFPVSLPAGRLTGIIVMTVGIAANAVAAILGRSVNRTKVMSPLIVTAVSMGIGAAILLSVGIAFYGIPGITLKGLMILLWLAGINTAFAFTLWNRTLRHLTAYESSIINGTMLIQIAVLSRIFLSETITVQEGAGMLLSAVGIVLVQMKRN